MPGSVVGTTNATPAFSTSIVIPAHGSLAENNVMVAFIQARGSPGCTPPSGWTLRSNLGGTSSFIYTKTATDSEPGDYTFTLGSSRNFLGAIVTLAGVTETDPVVGTHNTGSDQTVEIPQVTASFEDNVALHFCLTTRGFSGTNPSDNSFSTPSGLTEAYQAPTAENGNGSRIAVFYETGLPIGSTPAYVSNLALSPAESWRAQTISLASLTGAGDIGRRRMLAIINNGWN